MVFTASTSAAELIPPNVLRKSLFIQNNDSTNAIFLKWEEPGVTLVSSTVHDVRIAPLGAIVLSSGQDGIRQIQGRVTVVAAGGTPSVAVLETEDLRR
jgi:hypothetical protein